MGDKRDHAIKSRGSVFSALGFTVAEAEHLRIGSFIMNALIGEGKVVLNLWQVRPVFNSDLPCFPSPGGVTL